MTTIYDRKIKLIEKLKNKEYRDAFVSSGIDVGIAFQMKILRKKQEKRPWKSVTKNQNDDCWQLLLKLLPYPLLLRLSKIIRPHRQVKNSHAHRVKHNRHPGRIIRHTITHYHVYNRFGVLLF